MNTYDRLRDNLECEIVLRTRLLELMAEKRACLASGDLDKLQETLREIHPLLEEALKLQAERESLVRQSAPTRQSPPLRELIAGSPAELREELSHQRERLKELLERTARENRINTRLVRQSQNLHAELLQRLSGEKPMRTTYSARGTKNPPPPSNRSLVTRQV
ncbi:MAG: flagellar protein FlgN [Planctomycetota bacterium]